MRNLTFDAKLKQQTAPPRQTSTRGSAKGGLLDDSYFKRIPWAFGRNAHSRLVVHDDKAAYFVRMFDSLQGLNPNVYFVPGKEGYLLFAADKTSGKQTWARRIGVRVNAMVVTDDLLFVAGPPDVVDADERPVMIQNPYVRENLVELRKHRNYVSQPGSFYRRDVVETFGPLTESLHYLFDYDFFLRVAGRARAEFIPEVMAWFRIHGDSKTGSQETAFLREEPGVYRRNGGPWIAPFWFDYLRYRLWQRPVHRIKEPFRRVARRVLGVPSGGRIRS